MFAFFIKKIIIILNCRSLWDTICDLQIHCNTKTFKLKAKDSRQSK